MEEQLVGTDMEAVREKFAEDLDAWSAQVEPLIGKSQEIMREMSADWYERFDMVVIGGSHMASDVLEDAVLSFRLLRRYGVMVFDGIDQHPFGGNPLLEPQLGAVTFRAAFAGQFEVLQEGKQLVLRKVRCGLDSA